MDNSEWIFIGSLRDKKSDMAAYSAAGQLTQMGFIDGCNDIEYAPNVTYSMPLRRIFPKNKLIIRKENEDSVNQLGYINLPLIKQISFAFNVLSKIFARNASKFIICYNPSFILLLCGLLTQKYKKIDFIPMIYDVVVPNKNSGNALLAELNYKTYKKFLKFCKKIIVISAPIAKDFHIRKNFTVVEGGLPKDTIMRFDSLIKTDREQERMFKIVFAGGLEQENGIVEMIEAVKMLNSDDTHLYIYGSGPLKKEVGGLIGDCSSIHIMGYLEHASLLQHLKNADLLLNIRIDQKVSTKYFFPSKLIEYMYSGVPVLSTDFESLPEEYKTHLYITNEDSKSIARSIRDIIDSPRSERERKAISSKNWIIAEKSWDRQSSNIIKWAMGQTEVKNEE